MLIKIISKLWLTYKEDLIQFIQLFFQLIYKIGKPFYIDAKYCFYTDNPHEGWQKKELASGGCLIDMGYHIIDLLSWYFGLSDKVFVEMST